MTAQPSMQPDLNSHPVPLNSPHVMAATGVDRGDTPAIWNAIDAPTRTGRWEGVDQESGAADPSGHVTEPFGNGPGGWEQT